MVNKPRIGITGNARFWSPSWWCLAFTFRLAGATPKRISVRHSLEDENLDALVISGGDDISPELYSGETTLGIKIDLERDQLEIEWIKKALASGIPLLGICRGAQLINVVMGGALHQDIRPIRKHTYNRPGLLPTKQVRLSPESKLANICRKVHLRVNSLHNQAIKVLGKDLIIVGWDLDDITQAVESKNKQIIGLQWHPEYLFYLPAQFAIFRWLVNDTKQP